LIYHLRLVEEETIEFIKETHVFRVQYHKLLVNWWLLVAFIAMLDKYLFVHLKELPSLLDHGVHLLTSLVYFIPIVIVNICLLLVTHHTSLLVFLILEQLREVLHVIPKHILFLVFHL
jgi:hypothetical protein